MNKFLDILKEKRVRKLFIKAFIISFAAFGVATGAVGGVIAFNNTVAPPMVPVIETTVAQPQASSPFNNRHESDRHNINGDNHPAYEMPMLTVVEERRPNFFTFLLFGLDDRSHNNTLMVAAYDADTRMGHIISIPRDIRVDAQRRLQKINTGYIHGTLGNRGHEGGVNQLKNEVQTLVGFRPDFYVMVDFQAFYSIIDAVGGVEVDVPFHMRNDDPYQNLHIDIRPGLQVLDGQNALNFARFRESNPGFRAITDYQRIENQQLIISKVIEELLTPASLLRIPEFISIFNEYVSSDLAYGELMWFANQARHVGGVDALQMYTLPTAGTSGEPHWYELPHGAGIVEMVNRTVNPLARDITTADLRLAR